VRHPVRVKVLQGRQQLPEAAARIILCQTPAPTAVGLKRATSAVLQQQLESSACDSCLRACMFKNGRRRIMPAADVRVTFCASAAMPGQSMLTHVSSAQLDLHHRRQ
jgi:hypothetical protein